MASTRNINNQTEYNLKKKQNSRIFNHDTTNKIINKASLFDLGSNPNLTMKEQGSNAIDVESMLRGIKSSNLEGDSFKATPNKKPIKSVSLFKKPNVFIPTPFEHILTDRPLYLS
tara:strand:+ start:183 stop:527 length:345 start_codon:yes stop_codon:yes gene_type:complete